MTAILAHNEVFFIHSFEEVVTQLHGTLVAYCRGKVPPQDVDDLVQDIWVRLYQQRDRLFTRDSPLAYALGVAKHVVANYWRGKLVPQSLNEEWILEASGDLLHQSLLDAELLFRVRRLIDHLPKAMQPIVYRRLFDETPLMQLSLDYGIPIGTVKSRLYHGIRLLQKHLRSWPHDPPELPFHHRTIESSSRTLLSQWFSFPSNALSFGWILRVQPDGSIWYDWRTRVDPSFKDAVHIGWSDLGLPRRVVSTPPLQWTSRSLNWTGYQYKAQGNSSDIDTTFFLTPQRAEALGLISRSPKGLEVLFESGSNRSTSPLDMYLRLAIAIPVTWRIITTTPPPAGAIVHRDLRYLLYAPPASTLAYRAGVQVRF